MTADSPWQTLKPYLAGFRRQFIFGPLAKLIEAILELLMPLLMARVIDGALLNPGERAFFVRQGALLLGLVVLGMLFSFSCQYMASVASQGVGTALRKDIFRKIQTFSFAQLDDFGSSSLTNRLTLDVNNLQFAVAMVIRLAIRAPFLVIGGSILAFTISPRIAILMVLSIPLAALVLAVIMRRTLPLTKQAQTGTDKLGRLVSDHLSGVRIIRAFNRSAHERKYFGTSNQTVTDLQERAARISSFMNPGTVMIVNLAILLALYWGGGLVSTGAILPGQMIALINYFLQVLLALTVVANLVLIVPRTISSAERVTEVLEAPLELKPEEITDQSTGTGLLELRDVSHAYSADAENSLTGVSFVLESGATLGLIGATGSGKSTLARLLQRFYDPTSGEIVFLGRNLKTFTRAKIAREIAYVPQKAGLFSGTIRDNVTLGLEETPSDSEINAALAQAQALDFVEAMGGLDAYVERGGRNLSGGQKQRLSIARAIVRKPRLLILDDAASALDYQTEARLRSALQNLSWDCAVIQISQRIHSIEHCDRILLLDKGRVEGLGAHYELLRTNALYREIWQSQGGEL